MLKIKVGVPPGIVWNIEVRALGCLVVNRKGVDCPIVIMFRWGFGLISGEYLALKMIMEIVSRKLDDEKGKMLESICRFEMEG